MTNWLFESAVVVAFGLRLFRLVVFNDFEFCSTIVSIIILLLRLLVCGCLPFWLAVASAFWVCGELIIVYGCLELWFAVVSTLGLRFADLWSAVAPTFGLWLPGLMVCGCMIMACDCLDSWSAAGWFGLRLLRLLVCGFARSLRSLFSGYYGSGLDRPGAQ